MRTILKLAGVMIVVASSPTVTLAADATGIWTRPVSGAKIAFYDCGTKLCGKIVGQKDPARRYSVGRIIVTGAVRESQNTWQGDLFNPEDGQTYSGFLTLRSPNALNLKGCVLGGLICKDETLTR